MGTKQQIDKQMRLMPSGKMHMIILVQGLNSVIIINVVIHLF